MQWNNKLLHGNKDWHQDMSQSVFEKTVGEQKNKNFVINVNLGLRTSLPGSLGCWRLGDKSWRSVINLILSHPWIFFLFCYEGFWRLHLRENHSLWHFFGDQSQIEEHLPLSGAELLLLPFQYPLVEEELYSLEEVGGWEHPTEINWFMQLIGLSYLNEVWGTKNDNLILI